MNSLKTSSRNDNIGEINHRIRMQQKMNDKSLSKIKECEVPNSKKKFEHFVRLATQVDFE